MTIIPVIIQQHAEEAAILWLRRDTAVGEPHYWLDDLAKLDDQVEAHIDGLRIAGEEGWKICQQELAWEEPGEVFAAAVLALESGDTSRIDEVFKVGCSDPELERGLISAIGWTGNAPPIDLGQLMSSSEPARRRVGIAASAVRRQDPGRVLTPLVADDDPRVRSRAIKAAGELGRVDLRGTIVRAINDQDDSCRFWAAWSSIRLSDRSSATAKALGEFALQPGPYQERAAAVLGRGLETKSAESWISQLWSDPDLRRPTVIAIGAHGDPNYIDGLIKLMEVDEIARVAGEAFSMITGVDLAYDDLEQDIPEGFESGPTEDAEDENVALDPGENLPWPNPELVTNWWSANRGNFQMGHRYLCGNEISAESLSKTLVEGAQRQRAAAAFELALLSPNQPMFEVRARGDLQKRWLNA